MTVKPSIDFTIVGGGLVGSLLALLLAQRKYSVYLIEKQKAPKPNLDNPLDTRALALNYGTVELLKNWGFGDLLTDAPYITKVHVSDQGHRGIVHINADEENLPYLGAIAPFESLVFDLQEKVLHNSQIEFAEAGMKNSKILIGADGANSSIRKSLRIGIEEYDYHTQALIGKVRVKKQVADCAFERFTPKGPIALLPTGDCLYTMVWVKQDPSFDLKQLQQEFGFRAGIFVDYGVMKSYPLKRQFATETHKGHAGLLGNAAHIVHPVSGQGFNLAVRDILIFLEVLDIHQKLDESLWIDYEKRSAFQQKTMKYLTHSLVKGFETTNPAVALGRTLLLQCFELSGFARSELNNMMIGST